LDQKKYPPIPNHEPKETQNLYYKNILQTTKDGFWLLDAHGKLVDVNDAYCQMIGYTKEELLNFSIADLDMIEDPGATIERIDRIIKNGAEMFTTLHRKKDGTPLDVEVSVTYLDADGGRFICFCRNITERKLVEKAFREREEHFRQMYERSPIGYQSLDADGYFIEVNQVWLNTLGYQREEVLGHWFGDFLIPEMVEAFRERFPRFKAAGEVHNQFQMVRKDGQMITVEFDGKIGHDEFGRFKQTHCVLRDITQQNKLESALKESELKYRTLVDSGQALIWTSGIDQGCDYFSEPWLRFTGRPLEQELGTGWTKGIHPEDAQACLLIYTHAFENRENFQMEYRLRHFTGEYRWIQDNGSPRYDSAGIFLGYIGHCVDITERKLAEEALRINNEMFSQFMRHSPIYIFIKEVTPTKSLVLQASENFTEMIGIPGSEMIGKTMDELFPPEFAQKITADDWAVVSKGEVFREDEYLNDRTYTTIKFPIQQGDKSLLAGYTIDITERKLVEEALRRSEERYFLIDEASQDMIYSYDQENRFTHANTYLCQQIGLTVDQIIGKTHKELGYPQDLCDKWAEFHKKVYQTNTTVIEETTSIMPDGSTKFFEVVLNPIHDEKGEIIGIAGTTRDIHARKIAEAKIEEQLTELRRWHKITMGREERILELKREVNALLIELGRPPLYSSVGDN